MTKWTMGIAVLAFALGCSSSTGESSDVQETSDEVTSIVKQEIPLVVAMDPYSEADFLSKVEADADLQALWTELQGEGYTAFQSAGLTRQDDGLEVLWGEVAGAATGLVRHCAGEDC
ncbi:MAG: hypothetical protein HN341_11150, partial [Verrucomicrobia bacterium]|nr:hypothetical protein [Verrucomicrobiota bacterium]